MKQLVKFDIEGDTSVIVEEDVYERPYEERVGRGRDAVIKAAQTLEEALYQIKLGTEKLVSKLRQISESPDGIEVEFGIKMTAEVGAIIAASGVEGNFKVTLKWNRSSDNDR